MAHPLVDQLWFARSELMGSLTGVTEKERFQRFGIMKSILGSSDTWHARAGCRRTAIEVSWPQRS